MNNFINKVSGTTDNYLKVTNCAYFRKKISCSGNIDEVARGTKGFCLASRLLLKIKINNSTKKKQPREQHLRRCFSNSENCVFFYSSSFFTAVNVVPSRNTFVKGCCSHALACKGCFATARFAPFKKTSSETRINTFCLLRRPSGSETTFVTQAGKRTFRASGCAVLGTALAPKGSLNGGTNGLFGDKLIRTSFLMRSISNSGELSGAANVVEGAYIYDALRSDRSEKKINKQITPVPTASGQATRVIVITSGKGGVGKTTATANLGMSIARLGYRVALIDSDIGLRNLDLLLGLENRIMYTAMDILEGQCRLDQALIRDKRWKNLSLLSISKNRQRYNVTRKNMENLVNSITSLGYHFILIDCPAGIDVGFINAISPADEALIVTTPEITAIRDADRVAGLLEANGIYNTKLLVNRVRPDMIQRNDMMSVRDVQEMLGIPLLGVIPEDHHVIIATNRGEPLVLKKKLTLSGIAFENAARRLIGKQDYFIDLTAPYKGIFRKVQDIIFGV